MESYKKEFIEFMVASDVLKFGEFTLKSGRKSPFFMNAGAHRLFLGGEEHSRESVPGCPCGRRRGMGDRAQHHSAQPALPHHLYCPVGDPGSAHQLCHHHAHHQWRSGCPDRGMGTECLPQGLLGQPVRLWCCHFAGADRGGYGADACDRRCDAPSGKIPFLRNQEVRYEIFPETQV